MKHLMSKKAPKEDVKGYMRIGCSVFCGNACYANCTGDCDNTCYLTCINNETV